MNEEKEIQNTTSSNQSVDSTLVPQTSDEQKLKKVLEVEILDI